jgi:predicted membrane chloride channel (bestrophin family)
MMNALQSFVLATKKRRIRDEELNNNNNNSLLVRNASFVLIVSLLLPGYSKGFMPSHQITTHKTETKASISPLFLRRLVDKSKHFIEDHFGDDEDEGDEKNEWLSWMSTGIRIKKYNYDEVKMREDERLGGLPRSVGYSSRDWLHNTLTLATSAILRDISFPVISMTIWSTCISLIHKYLLTSNRIISAQNMCIPSHPHSLLVSSLGLLLVFRTNSAYQRFVEGRKIWEQILSVSRDLSRMIKLYAEQIGAEKHRRLLKLLAAFPYLLRHRIRPNLLYRKLLDPTYKRDPEHSLLLYDDLANYDDDAEAAGVANEEESTGMSRRKTRELYWVDKRTLPWRLLPKGAMEGCAKAQNRPLFICDRMAKEFTTVANSDTFSARERLSFLSKIDKLSECIGQCERIHQTVVPLNYARHALRSLSIWLLALPFALIKDLGLLTGPVVGT